MLIKELQPGQETNGRAKVSKVIGLERILSVTQNAVRCHLVWWPQMNKWMIPRSIKQSASQGFSVPVSFFPPGITFPNQLPAGEPALSLDVAVRLGLKPRENASAGSQAGKRSGCERATAVRPPNSILLRDKNDHQGPRGMVSDAGSVLHFNFVGSHVTTCINQNPANVMLN